MYATINKGYTILRNYPIAVPIACVAGGFLCPEYFLAALLLHQREAKSQGKIPRATFLMSFECCPDFKLACTQSSCGSTAKTIQHSHTTVILPAMQATVPKSSVVDQQSSLTNNVGMGNLHSHGTNPRTLIDQELWAIC